MAETEASPRQSQSGASEKRIIRTGPYPELTLTAVLVGYGLGILIALSIPRP